MFDSELVRPLSARPFQEVQDRSDSMSIAALRSTSESESDHHVISRAPPPPPRRLPARLNRRFKSVSPLQHRERPYMTMSICLFEIFHLHYLPTGIRLRKKTY